MLCLKGRERQVALSYSLLHTVQIWYCMAQITIFIIRTPMLRISKLTDYAMLIMSQLAKQPHVVLSASLLAEALHLSTPTVSKVLKMLGDAGLVASVRGSEGGYLLAKPAETVTVADVVVAIEGALAMTECCEQESGCCLAAHCGLKENWNKINKMVYNLLSQYSIMDMSQPLSA